MTELTAEQKKELEKAVFVYDENKKAIDNRDILLKATLARVEKYAPVAPAEVKQEAVIRYMAYVDQYLGSGRKQKPRSDDVNAMRASGAMALLAPWRIHGAGII